MKKSFIPVIILLLTGFGITEIHAQTASTSDNQIFLPDADRTVYFDVSDEGESLPILWGPDAGGITNYGIWDISTRYFGAENVRITRIPAFPGGTLLNGDELNQWQKDWILDRLNQVAVSGQKVQIMLNPGGADENDLWYREDWSRYALLMKLAKDYIESFGHTVVSITGFNEPEVWYAPATMEDNFNLFQACKNSGYFDENMRYCAGNTLNPDFAYDWYAFCIPAGANEGNTHQLAGTFDGYASFYERVKANGHYATNDEVHDIMEAIVGAEYGLQAAIFWFDFYNGCNYARGEFVKACNGQRLGYAEHRWNWTAAAVYRHTDGQVKAYLGGSERQATTTSYRFVSKDRPVYFEGQGPQREFVMTVPGGTGYGENQPNAERVFPISWGDDVQPEINGEYMLVNKSSGKVLEIKNGAATDGTNIQLNAYANQAYQQWKVSLVPITIFGDYSYYKIISKATGKTVDVNGFSRESGANVQEWTDGSGTNQLWYLEYVGDGYFQIRSKNSTYCLHNYNSNAVQWKPNGSDEQLWRFVPVSAPVEFDAPSTPTNLVATAQASSIKLDWTASPEGDVAGYTILRTETGGGEYNTIARNVTVSSFVDNTVDTGVQYAYKIKAVDNSLNSSAYAEVSAATSGENGLVAQYLFDGDTKDNSENLNHGATPEAASFVEGQTTGYEAISLNGEDEFVQLPATLANHQEITVAAWVYWNGGSAFQQIFNFGNDNTEYMYLSPYVRFGIVSDGSEQRISAAGAKLPVGVWSHVAVTIGNDGARVYVNGEQAAESATFTKSPLDFKPIYNYIGQSQSKGQLFNGNIDDFRMYNYALTPEEVAELASGPSTDVADLALNGEEKLSVWPVPANDVLQVNYSTPNHNEFSTLALFNLSGNMVMRQEMKSSFNTTLDVANLPSGIYMLRLTSGNKILTEKIIINH